MYGINYDALVSKFVIKKFYLMVMVCGFGFSDGRGYANACSLKLQ